MVVFLLDVSLLLLTVSRVVTIFNVGPPQLIDRTGIFLVYWISPTPSNPGLVVGTNVPGALRTGAIDVGREVNVSGGVIVVAMGDCDAGAVVVTGIGAAVSGCAWDCGDGVGGVVTSKGSVTTGVAVGARSA